MNKSSQKKKIFFNRKTGQAPALMIQSAAQCLLQLGYDFQGCVALGYLFISETGLQVAACLFIAVLGMEPRPACCFPATFLESLTSGSSWIFPEATHQNTGHTLHCQTMRLTNARASEMAQPVMKAVEWTWWTESDPWVPCLTSAHTCIHTRTHTHTPLPPLPIIMIIIIIDKIL